jgi:hypothetical protein
VFVLFIVGYLSNDVIYRSSDIVSQGFSDPSRVQCNYNVQYIQRRTIGVESHLYYGGDFCDELRVVQSSDLIENIQDPFYFSGSNADYVVFMVGYLAKYN